MKILNEQSSINSDGLNVLLVGAGKNIDYIKTSKFLRKFYTTSEEEFEDVVNIKFNTFRELAQKCRTLQIDLVIVEEEKWINEGIADVLKLNFINCIAPNTKWTQLSLSNKFARSMAEKYEIDVPPTTLLPNDFPLIVRGDGINRRADSIGDVTRIREEVYARSPVIAADLYLEKYIDGEKILLTSIYDGVHLLTFPNEKIDKTLCESYSLKLENMLQKEKADFIGFIHSEVIPYDGKLYNTAFRFGFRQPACNLDILYVLWLAIYQKINEIIF